VIARVWRGWATPDNAPAYERLVSSEVLPGIARQEIQGYRGAYLLRRELGDEVEFSTILLFDSMDALREFGGDDYEKAYVPPRAREVLSRFEDTSAHYETLMTPGNG
jgi:antibiotic biosynthesis monooxygenase (ABM) superfamily enzyme